MDLENIRRFMTLSTAGSLAVFTEGLQGSDPQER